MKVQRLRMGLIDIDTFIKTNKRGPHKTKICGPIQKCFALMFHTQRTRWFV